MGNRVDMAVFSMERIGISMLVLCLTAFVMDMGLTISRISVLMWLNMKGHLLMTCVLGMVGCWI